MTNAPGPPVRRIRFTIAAVATASTLGLGLSAAPARADFYECKAKNGRAVYTNDPGPYRKQRMKCRLSFATGEPELKARDKKGSGARSAVRSYTPPSIGDKGGPARESESLKERMAFYASYIDEAAGTFKLPDDFIRAVIRVESSFQYRAVSSVGAQGLMQLMPKTARAMEVRDVFDPRQNIMGGARLLRVLANRFDGDFVKVISAYHAGTGAVNKKGGIPFQSTEGYVRAVLDHYYRYRAMKAGR